MTDWIPGVSQLKSIVQLVCLDPEGAWETQKNFVKKCPLVSHVVGAAVGAIGMMTKNKKCIEYGKEAFVEGTKTIGDVADGIPGIGHVKGTLHYVFGDTEGAEKAFTSATRTSCVMGAGAAGFLIGGPVGAVSAGVGAGVTFDAIQTSAKKCPQGIWALRDQHKAGDIFDTIVALSTVKNSEIARKIEISSS